MPDHVASFEEAGIRGSELKVIDADGLIKLGISEDATKKMLYQIKSLSDADTSTSGIPFFTYIILAAILYVLYSNVFYDHRRVKSVRNWVTKRVGSQQKDNPDQGWAHTMTSGKSGRK